MFEDIYTANFEKLSRWCAALTHDRASAEDLAQEALLRAMRSPDRLENLSPAAQWAWLRKTAKNLLIDRRRRESRNPYGWQEPFCEDDHSSLFLEQNLACLDPQQRALVILRYVQGYNSRELGEMFGLNAATVRSKLSAALQRLRGNEENL